MTLIFDKPGYLYLCWLLLLLLIAYFFYRKWQQRARKKIVSIRMFHNLCPDIAYKKQFLKYILSLLSLLCVILALSGPKTPSRSTKKINRSGADLVFLVDVSKSMDAQDISPSRITKALQIVEQCIRTLVNDRVGVIVYAGSAYPLLPLTSDYSVVETFLSGVNTDMISSLGTSITPAFSLAEEYFGTHSKSSLMVLISDGEDHQGVDIQRITSMYEKGMRVAVVGVGTVEGGPIPLKSTTGQAQGYKKDTNGEVVLTKLNRATLEKIAQAGGGIYIDGFDTRTVIKKLNDTVNSMEKSTSKSEVYTDYDYHFQPLLILALVFLLCDLLIFRRKTIWMQRANLFNEKN